MTTLTLAAQCGSRGLRRRALHLRWWPCGGLFRAIHGACNHAGGPLGKGTLDDDFFVCPWQQEVRLACRARGVEVFTAMLRPPLVASF